MLFQVAGGCGLGTLKAADEAGNWGIGVDVDQYALAQARPHERGQARRQRRLPGDPAGEAGQVRRAAHDLRLQPEERRRRASARSTRPCPKPYITLMNSYKAKIIAGTLKVPASL